MAPDEYSTGGGGKLKLKGSKVGGGRVEKKKKKKAKKEGDEQVDPVQRQENGEADAERSVSRERDGEPGSSAKTETEKKYEEIRRKRLHERLQKEGTKTHKERVEELNKYLSRLSEHHDMYASLIPYDRPCVELTRWIGRRLVPVKTWWNAQDPVTAGHGEGSGGSQADVRSFQSH
ncbi:uncharacterized protein N7482_005845 [Penicillium canariense]|uniref:DUF1754-domain-containing protein n=1 Tax=Penicillium canariense TaxID=189055 RepID=A0A9W9LMN1_9EURO|nr:uncharacterized protein N7482_005845 [Penicillium canariense]KAJ5167064.1 hypothetical protein N7482_005845 [Penicillium canariense]